MFQEWRLTDDRESALNEKSKIENMLKL